MLSPSTKPSRVAARTSPDVLLALVAVVFVGFAASLYLKARINTAEKSVSSIPHPYKTNYTVLVTNAALFSWKELDSPEYVEYIARLRGVGCPRETLVDIVVSEVNRLYVMRAKELLKTTTTEFQYKYWQPKAQQARAREAATALQEVIARLDSERRRLLKQLLGDDIRPEEMVNPFGGLIPSEQDQKMSFVSYEKRRALEQIDKDATNLLSERLKLGQNTPEFRQFMHDLTASDDAKRRALLTPEEYFQYQLRFSRTASGLAIGLELMNPTEQEYLGIFKLQAIPDTKWNGFDHLDDPGQRAEYAQDYVDVKERIKDFLGPARFADYQRSGDPAFQDLQRYVDREQLSSQQAIALYDLKQTASAAADQLKANPTGQYLTDYQKLEALRRETVRQITEKLGPSASDKYLQSSSAEWVHSLGTASVPDRTP